MRKVAATIAVVASLGVVASACSPATEDEGTGSGNTGGGGALTVGWNQPFYSLNGNTSSGNNVTNANVAFLTTSAFNYYDAGANLQKDETFGSYEVVNENPLTVKYTVADDNKWSDGTAFDASDLLLAWAAGSGNFNTIAADKVEHDETTGAATNTDGKVFFDSASYTKGQGLNLVTKFPEVSDDQKSVTFTYDKPYAYWELDFTNAGTFIPAHIVAEQALGLKDAAAAKAALVKALQDKDEAALTKISKFWSTGFDFGKMPSDTSLLVSNGAYTISDMKENEYVTMKRNPNYKGMRAPKLDEITIRFNEDPTAQLQALQNGEIAMMYPQVTEDVVTAAKAADLEVIAQPEGTYEHIDLTVNNKGPFDPAAYGGDAEKAKLVRQAFIKALPRQEIVDKLIKPIQADAVVRNSFLKDVGVAGYDEIIAANGSDAYKDVDIEGAKALLQQAGVTNPKVRFMYAEGNVRRESEFALISASAKKAGFDVVDAKSAKWSEKLGDKSYDAVLFAWQSTSTSISGTIPTYITGGGNNFQGYSNKAADDAFDKIVFETDQAKIDELTTTADTEIWKDAVSATVFQFPAATIYDSAAVKNIDPAFLAPTMFYGFWNWEKLS